MKEDQIEFPEESRIDREAAEWVARRLKGFSPKEQDSFFDWLAVDPRHSEWYDKHLKTWNRLNQLAQWKPEHSERPNQDLLKYRTSRRRWTWMGGLAAGIAIAASLWFASDPHLKTDTSYVEQSLVANGYETHTLPDGTIVEMKKGAALKVDFSPDERHVELVSSEAHFEVAKNPNRPFIVNAGGVEFRAVGTAFNVKLNDDSVELLVTEGHVQMIAPDSEGNQDSPVLGRYTRELLAGQRSVASLNNSKEKADVIEVSLSEVGKLLAWKPKMLEFDEVPLSQVVEEFNRRNTVRLEIDDEDLAREPIVASFHTANVEHFVDLLEWSLDVTSDRIGSDRIVLRRER